MTKNYYELLKDINSKPAPFEFYTAEELWTNEHTAKQMLSYHLHEEIDLSSRNHAFIDKSVEWISKRFSLDSASAIADFGCGPGLYAERLAGLGAQVTGIDFSKNSLEYARKKAAESKLNIDYQHGNYLEYETDRRFDLIIMIFCDYCALSPEQRRTMLRKFHTFLKPCGSLLLDVWTLNYFDKREEAATYEKNQMNGFWSPNDYYAFVNTFKYETEKVTLDQFTIIEPESVKTVYNWLQYFSTEMLKEEFESCGFTIKEWYADVAGAPDNTDSDATAVIAQKK